MFCSCYFSVFLCRVSAFGFRSGRGGGGGEICWAKPWILVVVMSDAKGRESPPAKYQNIIYQISKYLETPRLTEDVFGECGRKPWRGDTPHAKAPLCPCQK